MKENHKTITEKDLLDLSQLSEHLGFVKAMRSINHLKMDKLQLLHSLDNPFISNKGEGYIQGMLDAFDGIIDMLNKDNLSKSL
jgi:hypothetical protein